LVTRRVPTKGFRGVIVTSHPPFPELTWRNDTDFPPISYTPDAHFKGHDAFAYRVVDGNGTASAAATVSLVGQGRGGKGHAHAAARRKAHDDAQDLVFAQFLRMP
jgi:hypothetical protein